MTPSGLRPFEKLGNGAFEVGSEPSQEWSGSRSIQLRDVRRGDVVRFASYALRVEAEPIRLSGTGVKLSGRTSVDGCPYVTKSYLDGARKVVVERGAR